MTKDHLKVYLLSVHIPHNVKVQCPQSCKGRGGGASYRVESPRLHMGNEALKVPESDGGPGDSAFGGRSYQSQVGRE